MTDIVLTTLNARYTHCAFGLRYLHANLGSLSCRAVIQEFVINDRTLDIAEALLRENPKIIGIGVYIWNTRESLAVVRALKVLAPEITVVIGGPEVSHEIEQQEIVACADYVISGEADHAFRILCEQLLEGAPPSEKHIPAEIPKAESLALPYHLYSDTDARQRVIYVEASRGCPFTCEFCLSSLEIPVRQFPVEGFLTEMQGLLDRGVQQFKFVDRTFNLNLRISSQILSFFLERMRPGLFVHFEMVPDRLPAGLKDLIRQFPAGTLQFEVGIQTFNVEVAALISRRQNYAALEDNIRFLRQETGVHIHADLIAGLPGESVESFALGFDRLVMLAPQEIQAGILKRLRGTPIARHTETWGMVYSGEAPYEVLQTKLISFSEMQGLRRFARTWDQIGNSGNFVETTPLLWAETHDPSPFHAVFAFSEWLHALSPASSGHSLKNLASYLFKFLKEKSSMTEEKILESLSNDFFRLGRADKPQFISNFERNNPELRSRLSVKRTVDRSSGERQARHLA